MLCHYCVWCIWQYVVIDIDDDDVIVYVCVCGVCVWHLMSGITGVCVCVRTRGMLFDACVT
jgi:hypothetical protein